jgi:hypothetical protein
MKIKCAHCKKISDKPSGAVNRANAINAPLFCDRRCAGLSRRKNKTKAQRIEEKRVYDAEYRRKNSAMLKTKKAAWHKASYDPETARIERKKRMAFHVEYCRRPSYKLWKREYDRRYRAKEYGPFADAYQLSIELNREIKARMTNYEIRQQNETFGKAQKRARQAGEPQHRRHNHKATYGGQP